MRHLSIIIPFVGEYPQVLFTIQSIAQNLLRTNLKFEIVAVDNWCNQVIEQQYNATMRAIAGASKEIKFDMFDFDETDVYSLFKTANSKLFPFFSTDKNRSGEAIAACAKGNEWLKYVVYNRRLSHWQAKRVGVENSEGKVLMFIDAHCVPSAYSISEMYSTYLHHFDCEKGKRYCQLGTMHLPLTYKILEWHRLIYKIFIENKYFYSYKFTSYREPLVYNIPYEVPCMSTCGMMITREIYDQIGGWPTGLGIYGGGENFMNYTLAVCGYHKYIYPHATLFHHGEKRDYHYLYDDMLKNRFIAHYLFGGKELMHNLSTVVKGRPSVLEMFMNEVIEEHKEHREKIKNIQKIRIEEWAKNWTEGEA